MSVTVPKVRTSISVNVVEAVAAATDTDSLAMDPPLHAAVDTDALDSLVESCDSVHVTFEYAGHLVTVDGRGNVSVEEGH